MRRLTGLQRGPANISEALALLRELGATPWLVRHHELVAEVAALLLKRLRASLDAPIDADQVLIGAALHDVGKLEHPHEMSGPGCAHEAAGERLLLGHGVPPNVARHCRLHAEWRGLSEPEPLLVAVADKVWKGKRVNELEEAVCRSLAERSGLTFWEVYAQLSPILDELAAGSEGRLARSADVGTL